MGMDGSRKSFPCAAPGVGRALGMGVWPHTNPSAGESGNGGICSLEVTDRGAVSSGTMSCLLPNLCQPWISMRNCHCTSDLLGQGFIA